MNVDLLVSLTQTILLSCGIIFLAELGDKSQLLTITFSIKYSWKTVLIGISMGAFVMHFLASLAGHYMRNILTDHFKGLLIPISIGFYLLFALQNLFQVSKFINNNRRPNGIKKSSHKNNKLTAKLVKLSPVLLIAITFFFSEFGDKTLFTTLALAVNKNALAVCIGSTIGMILADGLALVVGKYIIKKVSFWMVHITSALVFIILALSIVPSMNISFIISIASIGVIGICLLYLSSKKISSVSKILPNTSFHATYELMDNHSSDKLAA